MNLKNLMLVLSTGIIMSTAFGQEKIKIEGNVENVTATLDKFTIKIIEKGEVIKIYEKKAGDFKIVVPKNKEVIVQFEAANHFTRRMAIDSRDIFGEASSKVYHLKLHLLRKDVHDYMEEHSDLLDLPFAYIARDRHGKFFDLNFKESETIRKELRKHVQDVLVVKA